MVPQAYLFVGDIHGDDVCVEDALTFAKKGQYVPVFLGDLLDSFTCHVGRQIYCLDLVLDSVENGESILIAGNHEMSYLYPDFQRCSGYNPATAAHLMSRRERLMNAMRSCVWFEEHRVLVTHAGVDSRVWETEIASRLSEHKGVSDILDEAMRDVGGWFYAVGRRRGGFAPVGGPLWCDWSSEFTPIPDVRQVVGHTAMIGWQSRATMSFSEVREGSLRRTLDGRNWNIDGLQTAKMALLFEPFEGTFQPVRFSERPN